MDDQNADVQQSQKGTQRRVLIGLIILGVIILIGGAFVARWYREQDHSIYSKLATENYHENGLEFSFSYPRIMQKNAVIASKLPDAPVAYTYYSSQGLQAVVAVSHENIGSTLQVLRLKPAQFIAQLRSGSGSYISALKEMQGNANSYKMDFPGCTQTVITNGGQTTVLCVYNSYGHTYIRVIGATQTTQYTLESIMTPAVWAAHQKVWQKVEKSFSFH